MSIPSGAARWANNAAAQLQKPPCLTKAAGEIAEQSECQLQHRSRTGRSSCVRHFAVAAAPTNDIIASSGCPDRGYARDSPCSGNFAALLAALSGPPTLPIETIVSSPEPAPPTPSINEHLLLNGGVDAETSPIPKHHSPYSGELPRDPPLVSSTAAILPANIQEADSMSGDRNPQETPNEVPRQQGHKREGQLAGACCCDSLLQALLTQRRGGAPSPAQQSDHPVQPREINGINSEAPAHPADPNVGTFWERKFMRTVVGDIIAGMACHFAAGAISGVVAGAVAVRHRAHKLQREEEKKKRQAAGEPPPPHTPLSAVEVFIKGAIEGAA